jgi:2-hydroxy-3-keto-5-methylthiopentenyl-1-phosphate phosphatase
MESDFYIFGRKVGSDKPSVQISVAGIDYDGTIHMEDEAGNRHTFSGREIKRLRDDGLIVSSNEISNANAGLVKIADTFDKEVEKTSLSSGTRSHADASMKELFKAIKESAAE